MRKKHCISFLYTLIILIPSFFSNMDLHAQGPMQMFHILNQNLPLLNQNLGLSPDLAYSVRKLRNEYTGFAMKVRRNGSGNPEGNVMFDPALKQVTESSKIVVTKAGSSVSLGDTVNFSTFYGSGDVVVMTWYDQTGNSNHANQSTNSARPYIVKAGTMVKENGIACIEFSNAHGSMNLGLTSAVNKSSGTLISVCRFISGSGATGGVADNGSYSYNVNTWNNTGYIGATQYSVADMASGISTPSALNAIMWSKTGAGNMEINTPSQYSTIVASYPIAVSQVYGNAVAGTTVRISEFLITSYANTATRSNTFTNQKIFFNL